MQIFLADYPIVDDLLRAVDIGQEAIDRLEPLLEALIELRPLITCNEPREWIKGQDPLTGPVVTVVDAERGSKLFEELFSAAMLTFQPIQSHEGECLDQLSQGCVLRVALMNIFIKASLC